MLRKISLLAMLACSTAAMADVRISSLPGASTPLAGTEIVPIVQSATTVGATVSSFTAGRALTPASIALSTPLAITSGGIGAATLPTVALKGNGTGAISQAAASDLSNGVTGTGAVCLAVSCGLTTPALGTPSTVVLTNGTGLPLATGVTGTLGATNGGTGQNSAFTANGIAYASSTSALTTGSNLVFNGSALGLGTTSLTGYLFRAVGTLSGSTGVAGFSMEETIASGVTVSAIAFNTAIGTAAASFTLGDLYHYRAAQSALGASSAVTRQYGFYADSTLVGATNNYGFYGNITSASNRWNIYMAGTANNAFAGNVRIGSTTAPTVALDVTGAIASSTTLKNGLYTVSTLPTCNSGAEGTRAGITDGLAPTFMATLVGGGTVHGPAYCNGTNWIAN